MAGNRQWRLVRYPQGMPEVGDWALGEGAVPDPGPGQVLARSLYLDVAPYMRGRINPGKNYTAGVAVGDVMIGGAVAEVVRSNLDGFAEGDAVVTDFGFGWQDYAALDGADLRKVDTRLADLPCWLDVLGLNGVTAYFGLFETGSMRPGDTVVVSAAAGSVGQIVGQLAVLGGARPVALTSSAEKAAWCRELGYAAAIDYRGVDDLAAALGRECPGGVDVFFDNTGGPLHDAVMQNLATGARIVVCGTVSLADKFGNPDIGPRFLRQVLVARARIQGFLVMDHASRHAQARERLAGWVREGRLRQRFDIVEGLENTPAAFLRLLTSRNTGKQLVKGESSPPGCAGYATIEARWFPKKGIAFLGNRSS